MVKRPKKSGLENKGNKEKPDKGRAFLFGRKNNGADEFLSDCKIALDKDVKSKKSNDFFIAEEPKVPKTDAKKSNNLFVEDANTHDKNKEDLQGIVNEQKEAVIVKAKEKAEKAKAAKEIVEAKGKATKDSIEHLEKPKKKSKGLFAQRKKEKKIADEIYAEKSIEEAEQEIESPVTEEQQTEEIKKAGFLSSVFGKNKREPQEDLFEDVLEEKATQEKTLEQQNADAVLFDKRKKKVSEIKESEEKPVGHKKSPGLFAKVIREKQKPEGKAKEPAPEIKSDGKAIETAVLEDSEQLELIKKKQAKAAKKVERRFGGLFSSIPAWIKGIIPKRQSKKKALKFAQSVKHKKANKTKRVLMYAGAGTLAIVAALVFILVPFGQENDTLEDDGEAVAAMYDVVDKVEHIDIPTTVPTTIPTTIPSTEQEPEVSQTPIATTPADTQHKTINIDDMIDDCKVEANLYYNEVGYSNNYYKYTDNEIYILAQLIHGEARGESLDGMVAVGNVVMNRVLNSRYFGNSISAVVTASGQFSGYKSTIIPSAACKRAARKVLDFQVWVVPQNVYYFKASGAVGEDWASHKFYKRIGGHNFYTHSYGGRSKSDKIPPRLYERTYKWPRYGCFPEKRIYRIQFMLNQLGYDVIADSYFGIGTKDELKKFQEKKGLDADGVAGPSTIEALIRAYGLEKYYDKFYT